MAENTNYQAGPRPLADAELADVSGGSAWNVYEERDARNYFDQMVARGRLSADTNFEDYLRSGGVTEDKLKCRAYWISKGSPWDMTCFMDSSGSFSIL